MVSGHCQLDRWQHKSLMINFNIDNSPVWQDIPGWLSQTRALHVTGGDPQTLSTGQTVLTLPYSERWQFSENTFHKNSLNSLNLLSENSTILILGIKLTQTDWEKRLIWVNVTVKLHQFDIICCIYWNYFFLLSRHRLWVTISLLQKFYELIFLFYKRLLRRWYE